MSKRDKQGVALALALLAALVLGIGTGGVAAVLAGGGSSPIQSSSAVVQSQSSLPAAPAVSPAPTASPLNYQAKPLPDEMRAMWISFLEWRDLFADIAQAGGNAEVLFTQRVGEMFQNCADLGLNTVIAAVRPFGDALYPSRLFPWSHVLNPDGLQGIDPGFDPLAIMVQEAHARGLRIEAWVNPYRVSNPVNGPNALAAGNPAAKDAALVREVNGEQWYDPGLAAVEQLVVDGVTEIMQGYAVDGIHFDDYFYPSGIDETFDADAYTQSGTAASLADWRRDNTARMLQRVYAQIKTLNPSASFGVSMQGNNENNYTTMYADVKKWMANEGYVDYVMPQLYWGFGYRTQSGRESYAFANIVSEWAFYPRVEGVRLYAGLGAYRIGKCDAATGERTEFGDGGNNDQTEWESGHNLADMVAHLRTENGFSGFALFRYEYLYQPGDTLSEAERTALAQVLAAGPAQRDTSVSSSPPVQQGSA